MLLFVLVIYLSYIVAKPFLISILAGIVIGYIFYPLYEKLNKKIQKKYISSIIITILIVILLSIPTVILFNGLYKEAKDLYKGINTQLSSPSTTTTCMNSDGYLCKTYNDIKAKYPEADLNKIFKESASNIGNKIANWSYAWIISLPNKIFQFFIMLIVIFFIFIDGKKLFEIIRNLFSLKKSHENEIIRSIKGTTYAVIYGQVLLAIIEGILTTIGFIIFGIENAVFWGVIAAILALIPIIGVAVVWVPFFIFLLMNGIMATSSWSIIMALLFGAYFLIFVSGVDIFLKPKIIGDRARLHPLFVIIGVIGGIAAFGIIGFILGPIILGLLVTFIKLYEKDKAKGI